MPRSGSGIYSLPPGVEAVPDETIRSAQFNAVADDLEAEANLPRPLSAGGTAGTSKATAQVNLGVVPQETTSDATAGRLMVVGAGGWFDTDGIDVPGGDCDLITRTGVYRGVIDVTLNMPAGNSCGIFHIARSAARARQVGFGFSGTYVRGKEEGVWSDWSPVVTVDDTGTNANGSYVKYSDGTIECEAAITVSAAITTAHHGGYRSGSLTWTYPVAFTSPPKVHVTVVDATAFGAVLSGVAPTATAAQYSFTAIASAATVATRKAFLVARGK